MYSSTVLSTGKLRLLLLVLLGALAVDKTAWAAETRRELYNKILKSETLGDSLQRLTDVDMFEWPGGHYGLATIFPPFPLSLKFDQKDLSAVTRNQRVRKIWKELSELPKQEASKLVNQQFQRILPIYQRLYEKRVEQSSPHFRTVDFQSNPKKQVFGFSVKVSNNKDGTPTLAGTKYSLLALTLISGNLGLKDSRSQILKVTELAAEQYQVRSKDKEFHQHFNISMIQLAALYNRRILASALLQLNSDGKANKKIWDKYKNRWNPTRLTQVDPKISWFDVFAKNGLRSYANSEQTFEPRYLDAVSDEEFNEILAAARLIK